MSAREITKKKPIFLRECDVYYDAAIHDLKSRTARGSTPELFIQSRGMAKNSGSLSTRCHGITSACHRR